MNFLIHLVISAILLWAPQGLLDPVIFSCLAALFVFFFGGGGQRFFGILFVIRIPLDEQIFCLFLAFFL